MLWLLGALAVAVGLGVALLLAQRYLERIEREDAGREE